MSELSLIGRPTLAQPPGRARRAEARWLITFADLAAVMVAFFVLLFAMAEVDSDKWEGATTAFDRQFRISDATVTPRPVASANITQRVEEAALDLRYLERVVADRLKDHPALRDMRAVAGPDRIAFDFPGELLFASGRVGVSAAGREALYVLGGIFSGIDNQIAVVGHAAAGDADTDNAGTDNAAIDWEGSLMRASRVARALHLAGYDGPIEVQGRSGSRFGDAAEAAPAAPGQVQRRRIEIIVLTETGDGE